MPEARREVIDAAVQRNNPAIEQLLRRKHLAPEIVDHQDAVVGLHLARRDEHVGGLIEAQFQHCGRKLAAHGDAGAMADHPPRIEKLVFRFDLPVHDGVEYGNDVPVHFHRVGNDDGVLVNSQNALGDAGFAAARSAIQK